MSDFILIVPPDYLEVPNATEFVLNYGEAAMRQHVTGMEWGILDGLLEAYLPPGTTIIDARLIDVANDLENRLRLWFKVEPI